MHPRHKKYKDSKTNKKIKKFWIYLKCEVDLPETKINSREGKSKAISPLGLEQEERKRSIDGDNFITRFYL